MTNCACIAGVFNFFAKAADKKTIIFQDQSAWMEGEGYDSPSEYLVNVIPPASSKTYPVAIKVGQVNRLTETQFGTLKDGIYCFKVETCGVPYTRSVALFPKLQCCIKQLWATSDKSKHDDIREIEYHLNQVSINAELNNIQLADSELKITKKLLENIKCDCDC